MKKIIRYIIYFCTIGLFLGASIHAEQKAWSSYGNSPTTVLDTVAQKVNKDDIQDNAINDISNIQGQYASEYKIANTLDAIRLQINPYIQWSMYLGLSGAVILIILNGLLMVTNPLHGSGELGKVKTRLMNIAIGVGLLTGFYAIVELGLALISYILQ